MHFFSLVFLYKLSEVGNLAVSSQEYMGIELNFEQNQVEETSHKWKGMETVAKREKKNIPDPLRY